MEQLCQQATECQHQLTDVNGCMESIRSQLISYPDSELRSGWETQAEKWCTIAIHRLETRAVQIDHLLETETITETETDVESKGAEQRLLSLLEKRLSIFLTEKPTLFDENRKEVDHLFSILSNAIKEKQLDVIELCKYDIRRAYQECEYNSSLFTSAVITGDVAIVDLLLKDPLMSPHPMDIITALERGYLEIVRLLMNDTRIDVGWNNNYIARRARTIFKYLSPHYALTNVAKTCILILQNDRINPDFHYWREFYTQI
jgi:hypothetical protein